jgi:hypothetical protein
MNEFALGVVQFQSHTSPLNRNTLDVICNKRDVATQGDIVHKPNFERAIQREENWVEDQAK